MYIEVYVDNISLDFQLWKVVYTISYYYSNPLKTQHILSKQSSREAMKYFHFFCLERWFNNFPEVGLYDCDLQLILSQWNHSDSIRMMKFSVLVHPNDLEI